MAVATSKNRRWEMTRQDDIELAALVKHFELFNITEGKSPRTIVWYNMVLRQFQRFLLETGKSSRLRDIHELEVREFIIYLQAKRRWVGNPHVPSTDTRLAPMSIQGYVRKCGKSVHRGDFVKELHTLTGVFKVTPTGGVQTSSL